MAQEAPDPLVPLRDAGNELALRKPSRRSGRHELWAGEALVGVLDVKVLSGAAQARTAEETWRLDRPRGMTQRRVRVLSDDGATELTTFKRDGWGRSGAMELDGRRYALRAHGWWKPRWVWTAEDGTELAALTTRYTFGNERGRVTLTDAGLASPHAGLLSLLGCHLALLSAREQAAAAA